MAWNKHASEITSIQYECKNARTEPISKNGSNDPFAEPNSVGVKEPVTLNCDLTFRIAGDKLACLRVPEVWDDEVRGPVIQRHQAVFDGKQNRNLIVGGRLPMGHIDDSKTASDSLANAVDLVPLWLAYDPVTELERHRRLPLAKFQISKEEMSCDDCRCWALSAKAGPNADISVLLYIAATPDHRPLRWSKLYKGEERITMSLKYDPQATDTWALAGYNISILDSDGDESLAIEGVVKKRKLNQGIEATAFTIDFPEGAHIMQNGAPSLQKAGKLQPMKPGEYGQLPPTGEL